MTDDTFSAGAGEASAERAVADLEAAAEAAQAEAAPAEGEPAERPAPPADLTAAAFFDVDNTLVQGSSLVHFARGRAAREYFTSLAVAQFVYAQGVEAFSRRCAELAERHGNGFRLADDAVATLRRLQPQY